MGQYCKARTRFSKVRPEGYDMQGILRIEGRYYKRIEWKFYLNNQ
jgi:hypothetical protein